MFVLRTRRVAQPVANTRDDLDKRGITDLPPKRSDVHVQATGITKERVTIREV